MLIEVTQDDIDEGDRRHPCNCPVALAVSRKCGDPDASVTPHRIIVNGVRLFTPAAAAEFILRFDTDVPREKLAPFTFELPITA
jgi:hypothetical protein